MSSTLGARQPFLLPSTLGAQRQLVLSPLHFGFVAQRCPFSSAPNQQRQEPADPVDEFLEKLDDDKPASPKSASSDEMTTGTCLATLVAMAVLTPVFWGLAGVAGVVSIVIAISVFVFTLKGLGQVLNFFGIKC
jgi:hypothetical protein